MHGLGLCCANCAMRCLTTVHSLQMLLTRTLGAIRTKLTLGQIARADPSVHLVWLL